MSNIANPSYELADYARMIRRSWWIVVALIAVGTIGGFALTMVQTKAYDSSASVLVLPTVLDSNAAGSRTNGEVNLDTESQIVKSSVVLSKALGLLKQNSTDAKTESDRENSLLAQLSVSVPANTTVLVITCEEGTDVDAQACAHAVATAYITNRQSSAEAAVKSQVDALQHQIDDINTQIAQLTGKIAPLPANSPDKILYQAQIDTKKSTLNDLNTRMNTLTNTAVNGGNILADAQRPTSPASPNVAIDLGGGLAFGLVLGLASAIIRERADKRIRRGADIPKRTDVPLLAEFPKKLSVRPDEIFATYGTGGRMFSRLRNEVVASVRSDHRVVVVTGAARSQASMVVSGNLATAFARAGSDVIMVCANQDDGTAASTMLGTNGVPGLADVLAGRSRLADAIQQAARQPGLRVVPAGGMATAAGLLQSESMRTVIGELRRMCDYVIIEAPATSVSADAQSLAGLADAAVLVVELARTELVDVADAAEQLHRIGTPIIGAVVLPRIKRGVATKAAPAPAAAPATMEPGARPQPRMASSEETTGIILPSANYQSGSNDSAGGMELPSAGHDQTVVMPRIRDEYGRDTNKVPTEGKR